MIIDNIMKISTPQNKADLILHPIRLRILETMALGGEFTTQQLSERLPDIAQATLYRHLNKLASGGVIIVVQERPVRGTVEKLYALPSNSARLTQEDLANATKEDHMRYFTQFVAALMGDFWRYLQQSDVGPPDLFADGVGYRKCLYTLAMKNSHNWAAALNGLIAPALEHKPGPGRRRRLFSSIVMPAVEGPGTTTKHGKRNRRSSIELAGDKNEPEK